MVNVLQEMRPECAAGIFARDDGGVAFYTRVNSLLKPEMVLIDLGAGRGTVFHSGHFGFYEKLAKFQGKVKHVIGLDVDEAISDHPFLDERHVIAADGVLPVPYNSADIIVSDWVFEHVQNPEPFARELSRVLKPGGWLCARTPNRWGYVGIGARVVPNRLHTRILRHLSPSRHDVDVFPVVYRLNTKRDIQKYFPQNTWVNYSYFSNPTPKYFGPSRFLFKLFEIYQNVAPHALKTDLIVVLKKRE